MTRGNQRDRDRQRSQKKAKPPANKASGATLAERKARDTIALQAKQKLQSEKTKADGGTLKSTP